MARTQGTPTTASATPAATTPARKAVRKPAAPRQASQPSKAAPSAPKAAAPVAPEKEQKARKPKLVRDSFTIPKDEYAVIEALKLRAVGLAHPAKKSEILRAGLKVLAGLSDTALRTALQAVPTIKTGRPKSDK